MKTNEISEPSEGLMKRLLDVVEKVVNKVPHPAMIFLVLMVIVVVLHIRPAVSSPPFPLIHEIV